jgi:hypothetical protein
MFLSYRGGGFNRFYLIEGVGLIGYIGYIPDCTMLRKSFSLGSLFLSAGTDLRVLNVLATNEGVGLYVQVLV